MMTKRMLRRRALLRGSAAAIAAYPLLSSLLGKQVAADEGAAPLRFVCVYTANGHHRDHWPGSGPETGFSLPTELSSLAPHQQDLLIVRGCQGSYNHMAGHSEALTGRPQPGFNSYMPTGGPSLDQLFAKANSQQTPVQSLELGVGSGSNVTGVITFSEAGNPIPNLDDALGGFDRAFAGAVQQGEDPAILEARRQLGLSLVDKLSRDIDDAVRHLGSDERRLLDEHLTLLHEREQKLLNPPPEKVCDPTQPGGGLDFPSTARAHIDTIVQAFACDVTRVATLVIGQSGSTQHYPWVNANIDFHEAAHGAINDSLGHMSRINSWHAEQVAYLIAELAAHSEGSGRLLDNTLVFWTNELGVHTFDHHRNEVPVVIAGRAGGKLSTGRMVDVGAHYHDLLLTLAHAMGHPLGAFGDQGTQVLTQLFAT